MKTKVIVLIAFLLLLSSVHAIIISEIMYNPIGSDSDAEWIEIYTNETIDITGWKFYEQGTNHAISLINGSYVLEADSYAIIADVTATFLSDYPDFNSTLFDSSFSLHNSGELLIMKNGSLDHQCNITYNTSLGADDNGKSLALINDIWNESEPTPGYANELALYVAPENRTCDFSISINPEQDMFVNEKLKYGFDVNYDNSYCNGLFEINYLIYTMGANKIYLSNKTSSSTSTKSYTPKSTETDKIYFIEAILNTITNDTNLSNNYAVVPIMYINNVSNYLEVSILDIDNTSYDDYYRLKTNDIAVLIEGNIDDDYLDIYIKKSTRYNSNKHRIELTENQDFRFIEFVNLDYLCYEDDVDVVYHDEKPFSEFINLSKYYTFEQDNDELVNITLFVKNDNLEITKDLRINKTEFCYARYNASIFDEINKKNPVFVSDYLDDIDITYSEADVDDSITKFEVVVDYYDDILVTDNLPVKLIVKSNKEYNLTFDVIGKPTTQKKHSMKINKMKVCLDNYCDSVCSDKKHCKFHINQSQEKIVYMDIDTESFKDYLQDLDDSYSMFTLRLEYVKNEQKTVHKIDLNVIIPQDEVYDAADFSHADIVEDIPIVNDSISLMNDLLLDLNNSKALSDSEFIDISSSLKDDFATVSLSIISLLITCSEVYKKLMIFS